MITRVVRAENMLAALKAIQQELGPEALVVSVKQIQTGSPWQVWKKPGVEVVAVQLEHGEKAGGLSSPIPANVEKLNEPVLQQNQAAPQAADKVKLNDDTIHPSFRPKELNNAPVLNNVDQMSGNRKGKYKPVSPIIPPQQQEKPESAKPLSDPLIKLPPNVEKVVHQLKQQLIDIELIDRFTGLCLETLGTSSLKDIFHVQDFYIQQLRACIRIQKEFTTADLPKTICLVGSSGAGKTNTCAKLAVSFQQTFGGRINWICADTVRISAISEAQTYTESIGIPLHIAYTPDELAGTIKTVSSNSDVILIDTPACNPRKEDNIVDLGALLTVVGHRNIWIVTPATVKENDLQNIVAALSVFKPRGLIMTKLDETNVFGPVFNLAWRSQIPIVYYTFGNRIMNDLAPAKSEALIHAIFEEKFLI